MSLGQFTSQHRNQLNEQPLIELTQIERDVFMFNIDLHLNPLDSM